MGTRVLEFEIGNEGSRTVLVEVDDPRQAGNLQVSRSAVQKAQQTLQSALADVMPATNALLTQLRGLEATPESVGLEFGVKFTAEAGAIIARTSLEGNLKVILTWKGGV